MSTQPIEHTRADGSKYWTFGSLIFCSKDNEGNYYDILGTKYPWTLFDIPSVGLDKYWSTRMDDPYLSAAAKHDEAFNRKLAGYPLPHENAWNVATRFVKDSMPIAVGGLQQAAAGVASGTANDILDGLTTAIKFPIYSGIVMTVGIARYVTL